MTSISLQRLYEIRNPQKTLLEVASQERNENFYSNLLAFFLKPNEAHKLGIKVLKNLLETAYPEFKFTEDSNSVFIGREFYTQKDKKIDFFVHTKKYVIGIENKIDHKLNNPLADYNTTLVKYANNNKEIRRIILSIKNATELVKGTEYVNEGNKIIVKDDGSKTHEWIVVTYDKFFEQLLKDDHDQLGNSPYFDYLEQFIRSITNISNKDTNKKGLTNSQKKLKEAIGKKLMESKEQNETKKWVAWNDPIGCSILYDFSDRIQVYAYIKDVEWYVGIQLGGDIKSGKISLKLFQLLDEKSGELPGYKYTGNGRVGKHKFYASDDFKGVVDELLRLKQIVKGFLVSS